MSDNSGTHTTNLLKDKIGTVVFLTVKGADGIDKYAYMSVRLDKLEGLVTAYKSGKPFDPSKFGLILETGDGMPTKEVQERMTEEYGFDHVNAPVLSMDADATAE